MTKKKLKPIMAVLCLFMVLCFSVNTSAAALPSSSLALPLKNVSEEIFDGYTGLETTISGKVGYNYDLITADSRHTVLIGFNPNMTESYFDDVYNIGTGWQVKLSYLDLAEQRLYQANGYSFAFTTDKNTYSVKNYPGPTQLTKNDVYCFEKADGSKEYFSDSGRIIESVDAFGNETKYQYTNGILSETIYPDNTSIRFIRAQNNASMSVSLVYNTPTESSNFATLSLINDGSNVVLNSIQDNNGEASFGYGNTNGKFALTLATNKNYTQHVKYDEKERIQSAALSYYDGTSVIKSYYYDAQGRVYKYVDDFATEEYRYTRGLDGRFTIQTAETCQGNTTIDTKTLNQYGQLIESVQDGKTLELEYNEYAAVSQEKDDNLVINYLYSPEGKVTLADFSDGKEITYDYYPNGQLLKVDADDKATYYTLDGDVKKITSANQTVYDMNQPSPSAAPAPRSGYSVQYNINNDVGVTNAHSYYGLAQDGFNCYSFAIGRMENSYNPGMFSGLGLNLNSLTGIKYNVEQDQRALGRDIYNSGVNDSIAAHCWQIALSIRAGQDYHFMQRGSTGPWEFKAGVSGPVMRLLGEKNPNNVTWDTYYKPWIGNWKVDVSGYYNSSNYYMTIRG